MSQESRNSFVDAMDLLPNNEMDIVDIQNEVKLITSHIKRDEYNGDLTDEKKKYYYDELIKLSDRIADCSKPAFNIKDILEENYANRYKDNPKHGYKLFLNHYGSIHKPYDTVKKNIWKSLKLIIDVEE